MAAMRWSKYFLMLLAFSAALLSYACNRGPVIAEKEAKALTKVRQIAVAALVFEQDHQESLFAGSKFGFEYADRVIRSLAFRESKDNPKNYNYLDWSDSNNLNDPWGNSYFIAWQLDDKNRLAKIYVWSAGPDGINQFGNEDDIYSLDGNRMPWPGLKP
jgi:hypothetical protein